jgi:hypothetical protein
MKVELSKGRPALRNDIADFEQKFGESLPPDFLVFLQENDGSEPETNIFKIGTANESGVNGFIPIKEIAEEMQKIENLPTRSFPVAWAEGGNYVYINQALNGAVFFWDHELPDNLIRLSDSFFSFLESLDPFDIKTIKLKPGQVKKAWIDPDFLKSLGN